MATLAFNAEEIAPRELKPSVYELDGISRASVEAHYKLYQGYVNKRNEILGKLAEVDLAAANQVYSEIRALKVELTFAIGGIKNHEIYFEHLGGDGGDPTGAFAELIERDFGSVDAWRADLKATGMAGRGWAWTAYDWDEGRLFNYIGDAQNTFPVWNATPLVALDVYEHAYFLDYQTDRASYIDAFFRQPRLGRRERVGRALRDLVGIATAGLIAFGYVVGSMPWAIGSCASSAARTSGRTAAGTSARRTSWRLYGSKLGVPVLLLDVAKGFVPALVATHTVGDLAGALAGGAAMLGHYRPLFMRFQRGGKMVATGGGAFLGLAPLAALAGLGVWIVVFVITRYPSVASMVTAVSLVAWSRAVRLPWPVTTFAALTAVAVLLLHRENIRRLLHGEENRSTLWRRWWRKEGSTSGAASL